MEHIICDTRVHVSDTEAGRTMAAHLSKDLASLPGYAKPSDVKPAITYRLNISHATDHMSTQEIRPRLENPYADTLPSYTASLDLHLEVLPPSNDPGCMPTGHGPGHDDDAKKKNFDVDVVSRVAVAASASLSVRPGPFCRAPLAQRLARTIADYCWALPPVYGEPHVSVAQQPLVDVTWAVVFPPAPPPTDAHLSEVEIKSSSLHEPDQHDFQKCRADLEALANTDLSAYLATGFQHHSPPLPVVTARARVSGLDPAIWGTVDATHGVEGVAEVLRRSGALGVTYTGSANPNRVEALHHVLVVSPCHVQGTMPFPSGTVLTVGHGEEIQIWSPSAARVALADGRAVEGLLRAIRAKLHLPEKPAVPLSMPESESSAPPAVASVPVVPTWLSPGEQVMLMAGSVPRAQVLGAQSVYRLSHALAGNAAFTLARPLQKEVEAGLAVLGGEGKDVDEIVSVALMLSAMVWDSRAIGYTPQWNIVSTLQLYVLGLWPPLMGVLRPFITMFTSLVK